MLHVLRCTAVRPFSALHDYEHLIQSLFGQRLVNRWLPLWRLLCPYLRVETCE
jgi:hypothetical protein